MAKKTNKQNHPVGLSKPGSVTFNLDQQYRKIIIGSGTSGKGDRKGKTKARTGGGF